MLEIVACVILVSLVSLNALRRMDYLDPATAHHIRMTDASRSAYVGKNLADGLGYTTNDLPSSLVDFYDQRGKLHTDHWVNADRFPFTAYATAAFYLLLHSTSETVGILVYNLVCFVAFVVLLYLLARTLWGQRWSALLTVVFVLIHPYSYVYLYLKDADMLLLTVGAMHLILRYLRSPPGSLSRPLALGLGTLLAWLFLCRPNVGAPFVIAFLVIVARRYRRAAGEVGYGPALKSYALREGVAFAIAALWLVPFVVHSMAQWGTPMFSANNLYQLPLGTRFGMGTDTWWKYTEPGHPITLGAIISGDLGQLLTKFTTSWVATVRSLIDAYAIELVLAIGLLVFLRRARPPEDSHVRSLAVIVGAVTLLNLAILPLYGYQNYAYRHYLGFAMPLVWLLSAHALYLLLDRARPSLKELVSGIRARAGMWIAIALAGLVLWNVGASMAPDGNHLFSRSAEFFAVHWLGVLIALVVLACRSWVFRPPWYPRAALLGLALVYSCYRPTASIKHQNLVWFPASERVWDELSKRHGVVSSFALQGEVAWNTGRQNIPVPEWPMHIYSFAFDHALEIEDVYLESTQALLSTIDGPFSRMAPGFEGYQRLQRYPGHFPGYEVAFHETTTRDYPKFRVKAHPKASTDYKLVDRDAIKAIGRSPDRIDLGSVGSVIYTAHGWSRYTSIDGRSVVAATSITRDRYVPDFEGPWEDTSVTFFLDDRRPTSIDLDVYAPRAARYTFYWNLDLYAYDLPHDRAGHQVGVFEAPAAGWQRIHLVVPAQLTRKGLNKLGFRTSAFQAIVFCPASIGDESCLQQGPAAPDEPPGPAALVMHPADAEAVVRERISLFASALEFHYD